MNIRDQFRDHYRLTSEQIDILESNTINNDIDMQIALKMSDERFAEFKNELRSDYLDRQIIAAFTKGKL